jgi:PKD repeat protein
LIEDPSAACRDCSPPTSGFRNESFYTVPYAEVGEDANEGRMTDIFFGPYGDSQALYVISRGGEQAVMRIRYTGNLGNGPPVPVITVQERDFMVGEIVVFDGSQSSDPDGDELTFVWAFGDGSTGVGVSPNHTYADSGEYDVTLFVTDTAGQEQQVSEVVVVGKPPSATITSPSEGEEFYVGQIFELRGEAFDYQGTQIDDSQLYWEVQKHHANHFHPFLDSTSGNAVTLFPAPEPEDFFASTNSYLEIILTAIDNMGLTTEVRRIVQPAKVLVGIESNPQGLVIMVDLNPVETTAEIVSWKEHNLLVEAEDQEPYVFTSWSDGSTERQRKVKLSEDEPVIRANFCLEDFGQCLTDEECCSGLCVENVCLAEMASAAPTSSAVTTSPPVAPPSASPTAEESLPPTTAPTSTPTGEGDAPLVTIMSPLERQKFYVGQVFRLWGFGLDGTSGGILQDSQLAWEVRSIVDNNRNRSTTIMEPTVGNDFNSMPCPGPDSFLTATNSYLEMVLYATGENGRVTEMSRILQPDLVSVLLDSSPTGLSIQVDNRRVRTRQEIQSWKYHDLRVAVEDQSGYRFVAWEDGGVDRNRTLTLSEYSNQVIAIFCGQGEAQCSKDSDCCTGLVCGPTTGVCAEESADDVDGATSTPSHDAGDENDAEEETTTDNNEDEAQEVQQDDGGLGPVGIALIILACVALVVGAALLLARRRRKGQGAIPTGDGEVAKGDDAIRGHHHDIEKPGATTPMPHDEGPSEAQPADSETGGNGQADLLNSTFVSTSSGASEREGSDDPQTAPSPPVVAVPEKEDVDTQSPTTSEDEHDSDDAYNDRHRRREEGAVLAPRPCC